MKKNKFHIKIRYIMMYFFIALLVTVACKEKNDIGPIPYTEGTAFIAKWKDNKKAALTINFDDSSPGQATLAIPAMNEKGIKGTFYINPGTTTYASYKDYWEVLAPANGHELANHTMTHTGASTYEETMYEVGEASRIIWGIRGHEECGSLIAFNRGGGTTWNEGYLAQALTEFCNFDRQETIGESYKALSVVAGSSASEMYRIVPDILADSLLGRCHFHGIAANDGDPPMDAGYAGVWIEEFKSFLNLLTNIEDQLWIPTFGDAFKYVKERHNSTLTVNKPDDNTLTLTLDCSLDKKYFDMPLTIILYVPESWTSCTVDYNGSRKSYPVTNGYVMFDAKPNYGQITLSKN
jgi:hypothetical protein